MTLVVFESIPIKENNEPLVNLYDYPFVVEPAYFNDGMAPTNASKLRKGFADKLLAVQEGFKGKYRFKIWDAYRPRSVQEAIYNAHWKVTKAKYPSWDEDQIKNEVEKFITKATNKKRIPPHATGGAVDLTLVDEKGSELAMGTVFDHFGPEAGSLYYEKKTGNELVRSNRRVLRETMLAAGFRSDDDEWWHYDYGNQIWAKAYKKPRAFYGEA